MGTIFSGNSVESRGGGLFVESTTRMIRVESSSFVGNTATHGGGFTTNNVVRSFGVRWRDDTALRGLVYHLIQFITCGGSASR